MKLREFGAKIILGTMLAPLIAGFIAWAGLEIVEAANRIGVIEVRVDGVEEKEQRIYEELKTINSKLDKALERD